MPNGLLTKWAAKCAWTSKRDYANLQPRRREGFLMKLAQKRITIVKKQHNETSIKEIQDTHKVLEIPIEQVLIGILARLYAAERMATG